MTRAEYAQLDPAEQEHFMECHDCGEMFDMRSLDEVFFHATDHQPRPDIQYSGSERLPKSDA